MTRNRVPEVFERLRRGENITLDDEQLDLFDAAVASRPTAAVHDAKGRV